MLDEIVLRLEAINETIRELRNYELHGSGNFTHVVAE